MRVAHAHARFCSHPLVDTLVTAKGNPRTCLYNEPLWGIPYNLYAPFATVCMSKLGLPDAQVGIIASIAVVSQFVFAILSGVLTDRYCCVLPLWGRCRAAFQINPILPFVLNLCLYGVAMVLVLPIATLNRQAKVGPDLPLVKLNFT